jgi:hypothetical protein
MSPRGERSQGWAAGGVHLTAGDNLCVIRDLLLSMPMGRAAIGGSAPERMASFGKRPLVDQANVDFPASCGWRARRPTWRLRSASGEWRARPAAAGDAHPVAPARSADLTDIPRAADRLGVPVHYARRLVAEQRLPRAKIGHR